MIFSFFFTVIIFSFFLLLMFLFVLFCSIELDYDSSTPVKFSDFETSTHGRTRESIATSVSKYFKMDSDDDGAPSLYESSPRLQKGNKKGHCSGSWPLTI